MSALDFDISPAEAPPPTEATLQGTEPPPPKIDRDWYFYSLGIAISASFGVRGAQALFKRK